MPSVRYTDRLLTAMAAGEITVLLRRMANESGPARKEVYDQVVVRVYDELRKRARQQLRGERPGSLRPTALVNDVYERLLQYDMAYADSGHFFRVAATAMRRLLIERARRLSALRRGQRKPQSTVDADMPIVAAAADPDLLLAVDRAMADLSPAQVQLTELRFFVGLTIEEAAAVMGLNVETAKKRWRVVKALLMVKLEEWNPRDQ